MPGQLFALLTVAAALVSVLFALLCIVTVAASVRAWYAARRQEAARTRVRTELFARRGDEDAEWEMWVAGLSTLERSELAAVVERYLRTVSGSDREVYLAVARALGMGEQADETLDEQAVVPRLRALARLTLLEYPISGDRLQETCLDDRRTREAAARLLAERRGEFEHPEALGTELLLWDGSRSMTARGMETLFDLNEDRPLVLLSQGEDASSQWAIPVLGQVCAVLSACQTHADVERFDWVFPLFEADSPRVRAAAIQLFGGVGWRADLREDIPFRALVTDPSPRVRSATYRVLASWSDERARRLLQWAVIDESNPRAQLLAVRLLASLDRDIDTTASQPGWPDSTWSWVRAELDAAGSPRLSTQGVLV